MKSKISKAILASGILVCGVVSVNAQTVNKFGDNPMTINSHSVLELQSTAKGFLAPRMTLAQKIAMLTATSPLTAADAGMMIFQTDATSATAVAGTVIEPIGFYQFDGTRWVNQNNGTNALPGNIRVGVSYPAVGGAAAYIASQEMTLSGDAVAIDPLLKTVIISANSAAIKTVTATTTGTDLTLTAANNAIYVTGAVSLVLPDPATSSGRTYTFNKTDGLTLTFSRSITDMGGTTFTTTNVQKSFRLQSNGTNWYLLN